MPIHFGYAIYYVEDVAATLGYYRDAFELELRFVTDENDYGELDTGGTTLAFASNGLAQTNLDGGGGFTAIDPTTPPPGATITLVTPDVSQVFEAAIAAGGTRYVDPTTKPWGQTVGYLRDPNGILVEIASPM